MSSMEREKPKMSQAQIEQRQQAGKSRAKAFDKEHQREARAAQGRKYTSADYQEWGRKGYAALVAKVGPEKAHEMAQRRGWLGQRALDKRLAEAGYWPVRGQELEQGKEEINF